MTHFDRSIILKETERRIKEHNANSDVFGDPDEF